MKESRILIIFEDKFDRTIVELFSILGFVNIIFIDLRNFEMHNVFGTVTFYPNLLINDSVEFIESMESPFSKVTPNLYGSYIKVVCPLDIPNCMFSESSEGGLMMHMILDFAKLINASIDIYCNQSIKADDTDIKDFDIIAMTFYIPKIELMANFHFFQISSYPLDTLHIFVVVPSSKPIDMKFYPFKPFSFDIWICTGALILYSTTLMSLCSNKCFGQNFSTIIRLIIAQSVPLTHNHAVLSTIYVLNIIFGFIINLWFGAILGSYMSTFLKEKPITCLEDIGKKGLWIIIPNTTMYQEAIFF